MRELLKLKDDLRPRYKLKRQNERERK